MIKQQSGYILVTGLVFMTVIGLATIASMEGTNLDYKVSSNEAFKNVSFQSSESGRLVSGESLSHFIYHRQWDELGVSGVSFDETYDPSTDNLKADENLYSTSTLDVDLVFTIAGTGVEDVEAYINLIKAPMVMSDGSGLQQLSGYEGLGKGAGAGGVNLMYEIRSYGESAAGAVTVTASEYKVVP